MTSNIAARKIQEAEGSVEEIQEEVFQEVRRHFRPEFINRIDEVITFDALTQDQLKKIVDIQIERFQREQLAEKDIRLNLDESARELLAEEGFDPDFGARPLERVIQREVQNPLATMVLEDKLGSGQTVNLSAENGELTFDVAEAAEPATAE
jgi:ATP-dependent Clp protease ATP-binding subunit ClpA